MELTLSGCSPALEMRGDFDYKGNVTVEKRRRNRSRCRIEAVVETEPGGFWKGPCRDISMHGLYLTRAAGAAAGARCRVAITLQDGASQVALAMRGRIVRVEPAGMAVAFESMGAETSWHLRNIIVVHAADHARARGELSV
ncbi:PilZ domain-containing protein [bacterium]|nr:MAG: PilZ domain-containing protein [bacterium]